MSVSTIDTAMPVHALSPRDPDTGRSPPAPARSPQRNTLAMQVDVAATSATSAARSRRALADNTDEADVTNAPRSALRAEVQQYIMERFPDVRSAASSAISEQLWRSHGVKVNPHLTYLNWFSRNAHLTTPVERRGDGKFIGPPTTSRSLTDVQLLQATRSTPITDSALEDYGVYTDGRWSKRFGPHNQVGLSAGQVLEAARQSQFLGSYGEQLRSFWNDNAYTLQTLSETSLLDYVEQHRRADNRARALGVDSALDLSSDALAMIAEASGQRDPDLPPPGTEIFRFDINGYYATDMVWLRGPHQRIVLVIPGDAHPLREYRNLDQMREGIRDIIASDAGRAMLGAHFKADDRPTFWYSSYDGVDKWLKTLADDGAGYYNYAIAGRPRSAHGEFVLGQPDAYGRSLLSDKAVAMLSEAAGQALQPPLQAQGTRAYFVDINGLAATDMLWLEASDGRAVLIMPGNQQPVREYANRAALREALLAMLMEADGARTLGAHFSPLRRRGDATREGVDRWISNIRRAPALHKQRILHDPDRHRIAEGINVFRAQNERRRDHQLELLGLCQDGAWTSEQEQRQWLASFELARQFFYSKPEDALCTPQASGEASSTLSRPTRSGQDFIDLCQRTRQRVRNWSRSLGQRLSSALTRLRQPPLAPTPTLVAEAATTAAPASADAVPADLTFNARGFLEGGYLPGLYVVVPVRTTRQLAHYWLLLNRPHNRLIPSQDDRQLPERVGIAPQDEFAVGRRALDGDVIDAFTSPEAARRAAMIRYGELAARAPMYRINGAGLTTVSFALNRRYNPEYARLMADGSGRLDNLVTQGDFAVPYAASRYAAMSDDIVQVRYVGNLASRLLRYE